MHIRSNEEKTEDTGERNEDEAFIMSSLLKSCNNPDRTCTKPRFTASGLCFFSARLQFFENNGLVSCSVCRFVIQWAIHLPLDFACSNIKSSAFLL